MSVALAVSAPHGWETFGDFADDAALGILLFVLIPLAVLTWWANRKDDPK